MLNYALSFLILVSFFIVQDVLFLLAYLNSCLNPVVYGGFYFKNFRKRRPQNGFIVQQVAARFMLQRQEGAAS